MINLKEALNSSIGRKFLNAITAIGLVVFIILHLGGNLTLLVSPEAFNGYAAKLHGLGMVLYVLEIGLLAAFVFHIVSGIALSVRNSNTRSQGYRAGQTSKKGPSNYGLSSTNMIITGLVLLGFLVLHLAQFRLLPFFSDQYTHGNYYKELYTLVDNVFKDGVWVAVYCGVMVFLGFHLRHGIWSMFQSIGAMNNRWKTSIYGVALVAAFLIAVGFFVLPIGLYMDWLPLSKL